MGFFDLFRPRYRHSDPKIRAEAVRELDADQNALIEQILREDPDTQVRRIAWKKIEDPERLESFARDEQDDTLKKSALERAQERWLQRALSEDEELAGTGLGHLRATRDLLEVVRRSPSATIAERALTAITEQRALKDIALSDGRRAIALAAITRLTDPEHLETVAKQGKTKAIRAAAEAKVPKQPVAVVAKAVTKAVEISQEKKNRARQLQLCRNLETLVQERSIERAKAERDSARTEWLELSWVAQDADIDQRFERVCAAIERIESEGAEAKVAPATEAPAPSAAVVAQEESPEAREAREAREAEKRAAAERRRADDEASRKRREEDIALLKQRIDDMSDGLERAASDETLTLKRALETLDTAKAALASDEMKDAPQEVKKRLVAVRDRLAGRITELREADRWKRWANVPLLEKLCTRAEAIAANPEAPDAQKELRALRDEWKAIGPAPKDKHDVLWDRFKKACDALGEKGRAEQAVKREEMVANLAKREELISKAEALADSMEWKETSEALKTLQAEWKTIGPVRRSDSEKSWGRFRAACDKFFERRKAQFEKDDAERGTNLKKREELIAKAEAVANSTDWRKTTEELKSLQATWKEVGPVPRDHAETSWQRFRAACDKFFERKKEHFGALDAERAKEAENEATPEDRAQAAKDAAQFGNKLELGDLASKLGIPKP